MPESTNQPIGESTVLLGHGGGGFLTQQLLESRVFPHLQAPLGEKAGDSVVLSLGRERLAFTTDSYVVTPWEFPGGDIGRLAVCGTVNDLAVVGAEPRVISLALILEEGFSAEALERLAVSIETACAEAGVQVVTGDTKVVERGRGDGIYINTAGLGVFAGREPVSLKGAQPGDAVIVSGTIGDHGMAVMQLREDLGLESVIRSDVAPLAPLVAALREGGITPHVLKDPTRGGLAMALNEIARASHVHIEINEPALPVNPAVARLCDLLGIDVLEVANEGKLVLICHEGEADRAVRIMRDHSLGRGAQVVGRVVARAEPLVTMRTIASGERVVTMPAGETLPRIC